MALIQGAVVLVDDPFHDSGKRPAVVVNNRNHPFHGKQYVVVALTGTNGEDRIEVNNQSYWEVGGPENLDKPSYITPWSPFQVQKSEVHKEIGILNSGFLEYVLHELFSYLLLKDGQESSEEEPEKRQIYA